MKIRYVLGAAAVLSTVAFGYQVRRPDGAELARLRGEVERLSQEASARPAAPQAELWRHLLGQQQKGLSAPAAYQTAGAAPATAARGAADPKPPLTQMQVQERYGGLFHDEALDPRWASSAQTLAQDKLRRALPQGSEVRAVECRTSLCRIETSHGSREEYQQFVRRAFLEPDTQLWNGAMSTGPLDDAGAAEGRVVAVSYLAKDGQALPRLD